MPHPACHLERNSDVDYDGFALRFGAPANPAASMEDPIDLRPPRATDAADVWRTVHDGGSLDVNSPYAYLLVCEDFASTSVVATEGDELVGFVAAYRPPRDPEALFVWQVAVAERARGRGLGRRLLLAALQQPGSHDARYLTATVTPDNEASLALFRGIGRDLGVEIHERVRFPASLFPAGAGQHAPETELRIGPLPVREGRAA